MSQGNIVQNSIVRKVHSFVLCLGCIFLLGCMASADVVEEETLKPQQESDHFLFYSFDKDKACLDHIANSLESNYERITEDLRYQPTEKITVEIYPDIDSFHQAMGRPDAPHSTVGTAMSDRFLMVSPLNPGKVHTYDSLMKVAVHEFTHVITIQKNPKVVESYIWLIEGIATYEAEQMDDAARYSINSMVNRDMVPGLYELNFSFYSINNSYALSGTLIEYLVNTYGMEVVAEIINSPNQIEKILGFSKPEMQEQWHEYLSKNYGNKDE